MNLLQPGVRAPDFSLPSTPDQQVSLSDFAGRNVVLVFYPADWSPVCGDQLQLYNELLPMFVKRRADMLALSCDGVWCHLAYARHNNIRFPLLSDFEPKGSVARLYGAYRNNDGVSERALFVINPQGIIHWSYLSPVGVNPGADGMLDALDSLTRQERISHDQSPSETTSARH